jgi:hypothetical protein
VEPEHVIQYREATALRLGCNLPTGQDLPTGQINNPASDFGPANINPDRMADWRFHEAGSA